MATLLGSDSESALGLPLQPALVWTSESVRALELRSRLHSETASDSGSESLSVWVARASRLQLELATELPWARQSQWDWATALGLALMSAAAWLSELRWSSV